MKVLFQSRKTLFSVPGGDTIQMLKTAEALRLLGVDVDVSTELEPDLGGYDLVHLFNLMRPQEVYLQALNAKKQHKKVALSTVYGPYMEYERQARGGAVSLLSKALPHHCVEYLKILARAVRNREYNKGTAHTLLRGYRTLQEMTLNFADVLLPNSEGEVRRVMDDFPPSIDKRFVVVYNAVDATLFDLAAKMPGGFAAHNNCILCVARIEGRKCQLDLVRAVKGLPYQLVLIGKPAPNHMSYFEQIKREAGPNVHILGHVAHDRLPQFYKAAKVHALISWMETPGLSSLEAGAMGCNLVITEKGDTRDYFGDYAWYCRPDSVESIRNALVRAYESPRTDGLREHILKNFIWERTAEKTIEGYNYALGLGKT